MAANMNAGSSGANSGPIDPSNPLFVHSSDVPGACLVPTPFSGSGYGGWKRKMTMALSAKNKICFIDGSFSRPSNNVSLLRLWDRCNMLVMSWLTSSVSSQIADSVQYSDTARSMWSQLEKRYGTPNKTKIFELKRELSQTSQGSLDVASYFNKLKSLWDELGTMVPNHGQKCTCAAKNGIIEEDDENKIYQFLMGLNETYLGVRSNLLMMQHFPSLDSVYNIVLNDEKQRQVKSISHMSPAHTDRPPAGSNQGKLSGFNFRPKVNFEQNRGNLFCRYCKKSGHLIDKCFKLHGFPQSNSYIKGRKSAAHLSTSTDCVSVDPRNSSVSAPLGDPIASQPVIPGLSRQQCDQIVSLIQQTLSTSDQASSSMSSANFAGTFMSESLVSDSKLCMLTHINSATWIIDSGASNHMTYDKNLLFDIIPLTVPYLVSLPNGYKVKVTCTGSFALTPSLTLHNVLLVPSFKHNLISVHKLMKQLNCLVLFTPTSCLLYLLQDLSLKRLLDLGKEEAGLYKYSWSPSSSSASSKPSSLEHSDSDVCNDILFLITNILAQLFNLPVVIMLFLLI